MPATMACIACLLVLFPLSFSGEGQSDPDAKEIQHGTSAFHIVQWWHLSRGSLCLHPCVLWSTRVCKLLCQLKKMGSVAVMITPPNAGDVGRGGCYVHQGRVGTNAAPITQQCHRSNHTVPARCFWLHMNVHIQDGLQN